ncbi:MAG: DUF2200 family protein [Bacilli bacterium]
MKENHKIYTMKMSQIALLYIAKAERKGYQAQDVYRLLSWLTGYDPVRIDTLLKEDITVYDFYDQASHFNPHASRIKGSICGVELDTITDPIMQKIRYSDKLIDDLVKGKNLDYLFK